MGAVGETLFPADGGSMPTVQDAKVIDYMDDLLLNLQFQERILIRALLTLVEVQSLAFNGWKPKLFSRATMDERTRNLKGWETSRLFHRRVVFMSIRTLLLWAYVDSREAERGIGLDPESRQEARQAAARRAILRASQAQAEASSADSFSGRLNAQ
ncbi:MAG: hypothetical protein MK135_02010 [Polyangiaceae bacterium]|nr:hypothetical protein [Polyangiaceae bacterium]